VAMVTAGVLGSSLFQLPEYVPPLVMVMGPETAEGAGAGTGAGLALDETGARDAVHPWRNTSNSGPAAAKDVAIHARWAAQRSRGDGEERKKPTRIEASAGAPTAYWMGRSQECGRLEKGLAQ
jgi:hypothetical protein